ncbi:MAG TPA: dipeptide ABC transporter ATP-binding protein [Solirubrobacteraceae bacterium]|nr:dipeptide ABC transporter ATP-binding protein [Solirubrobacteraceae bacterium]
MSAVAEARDLTRHYSIRRGLLAPPAVLKAVDGVSFSIEAGRTLAVVGESGCGKSTLARMVTLIEPPTAGELRLIGRDAVKNAPADRTPLRRAVQIVFQNPYGSLNPRKKIGSILEEPLVINTNLAKAEREAQVREMMAKVGLRPEHYHRYPHMFSGGQRQRIAIARALMLRPKLVVADEPVSALDVSIQAQVLNLLRNLQREMGLTLIFIAHDLSVVRHMCDRVAVMYLGKVVEVAPSDELYSFPRHPYTGALLSAVPVARPSGGRRRDRQLLTGDVPSPANPPRACRFHTRCPKAQEVCSQEEPVLELKSGNDLAACHFPLTEAEIKLQLPTALGGANASTSTETAHGAGAAADQPSSSSST